MKLRPQPFPHMRRLWLALLFFTGGAAHEIRHPLACHSIAQRQRVEPRRRTGA